MIESQPIQPKVVKKASEVPIEKGIARPFHTFLERNDITNKSIFLILLHEDAGDIISTLQYLRGSQFFALTVFEESRMKGEKAPLIDKDSFPYYLTEMVKDEVTKEELIAFFDYTKMMEDPLRQAMIMANPPSLLDIEISAEGLEAARKISTKFIDDLTQRHRKFPISEPYFYAVMRLQEGDEDSDSFFKGASDTKAMFDISSDFINRVLNLPEPSEF